MALSQIDLELLHIIELDPTISVQELAKKTGVSWITANKHIKRLRKERVLSEPIAVFNPDRLGLERHVVMIHTISEKSLELLETACDVHPYTHYRVRTYGPYTGLFIQFDIPPDGSENLRRFLELLSDQNKCKVIVFRRSTGYRTSTRTNLQKFDSKTMSWDYDWELWANDIANSSDRRPQSVSISAASNLTPVDLQILRELTANANVNQTLLQEKLALSQSSVSRKVIALTDNYIESVRAQIDRSRFDVTSTKMFYCQNVDVKTCYRLYNSFSLESSPPFPIYIDLLEDHGVLIWGRMPPSHEHQLFYTLWRYLPTIQVFTMDTVRNHSRLYWFYPENYDAENRSWRTDSNWMIEQPLKELKRKFGLK